MQNKIEIIPVSILDEQRPVVNELKKLANELGLEFGWHYLLDLTWVIREIGKIQSLKIIDAGAGIGLIQWYLAQHGGTVYSIDRMSRKNLPLPYRSRFHVKGMRESDLTPARDIIQSNLLGKRGESPYRSRNITLKSYGRDILDILQYTVTPHAKADSKSGEGQVIIYNQDLSNLEDIQDASIDAIVSISALEHNSPEGLEKVVKELMRVLKPGGVLLATLGAAKEKDWFHKPSSGWCYTDTTLRRIFDLPDDTPSNYDQYDQLFTDLKNCAELRDNLASFYFLSNQNGMPLGEWDPKYQPVGVRKEK